MENFLVERMEHLVSGNILSNNDKPMDIRPEQWRPRSLDTNNVIPQFEEVEANSKQILEHNMNNMIDALHDEINKSKDRGLEHKRTEDIEQRIKHTIEEEKELHRLACLPLYHGAHVRVVV